MKTLNKITLFIIFTLSFILSVPIIVGELVSAEDAREVSFIFWMFVIAVSAVVCVFLLIFQYSYISNYLTIFFNELCSKLTW